MDVKDHPKSVTVHPVARRELRNLSRVFFEAWADSGVLGDDVVLHVSASNWRWYREEIKECFDRGVVAVLRQVLVDIVDDEPTD